MCRTEPASVWVPGLFRHIPRISESDTHEPAFQPVAHLYPGRSQSQSALEPVTYTPVLPLPSLRCGLSGSWRIKSSSPGPRPVCLCLSRTGEVPSGWVTCQHLQAERRKNLHQQGPQIKWNRMPSSGDVENCTPSIRRNFYESSLLPK